jgi:hypothetical protein
MIAREILQQMFDGISEEGQWDMSEPMMWGYFFTHPEKGPLARVVPLLQARDYEFVDLYQGDENNPADADLWWLHVQRVEAHSVDSLFARNEQLREFASDHGLDSYDGMDVGPVPGPEGHNG